jgi:hypothetical protein
MGYAISAPVLTVAAGFTCLPRQRPALLGGLSVWWPPVDPATAAADPPDTDFYDP